MMEPKKVLFVWLISVGIFGVCLLLSEDMVYVGPSSDLSKRIKQHIIGKDWWKSGYQTNSIWRVSKKGCGE